MWGYKTIVHHHLLSVRRNLTRSIQKAGNQETFLQLYKRKQQTKYSQQQQNWLLFRKKQDNKDLACVFRTPEIFFGSKKFRAFGTFERGFCVPTTFTSSLIPLIGATCLYQVLAMLGQFSLCFRMILQPKPWTEPCQTWCFSGIREALQLVVPKNWKWRPARRDAEHPGILWTGFTRVSAWQTKGRAWLEILQCYLIRWCLKFRANLYDKKAHQQNWILQ